MKISSKAIGKYLYIKDQVRKVEITEVFIWYKANEQHRKFVTFFQMYLF